MMQRGWHIGVVLLLAIAFLVFSLSFFSEEGVLFQPSDLDGFQRIAPGGIFVACTLDVQCSGEQVCYEGRCEDGIRAMNPVLPGSHPDPHVLKDTDSEGELVYYLTHTAGYGDIPLFSSNNLVGWTEELHGRNEIGLFERATEWGEPMLVNGDRYCDTWAPAMVKLPSEAYMLSMSARRLAGVEGGCGNSPFPTNSGVYNSWDETPSGQFAAEDRPWEPIPAGARTNCQVRNEIPHSIRSVSNMRTCDGFFWRGL